MRIIVTILLIFCLAPVCWCTATTLGIPLVIDASTESRACCDKLGAEPDETGEVPADCGCCLEQDASMLDRPDIRLTMHDVATPLTRILPYAIARLRVTAPTFAHRAPGAERSPPAFLAHARLLL
jgi:hypothetical protein|tara:strand:+ start:1825 stop:2199 length:375 start_codon:yes stop_codon:yes gene_type:complete